ncbi:hypothetical protein CDAR_210301 [Caerostris darwini]|uniref:Uncharacterized protein n=1 Tax=Caerostris darwini TaxID=1538125 RepID=A0AAV4T6W1_9ARAC|nr:hypothetical protein CDAR_210301 [Caerostris darwini]
MKEIWQPTSNLFVNCSTLEKAKIPYIQLNDIHFVHSELHTTVPGIDLKKAGLPTAQLNSETSGYDRRDVSIRGMNRRTQRRFAKIGSLQRWFRKAQ